MEKYSISGLARAIISGNVSDNTTVNIGVDDEKLMIKD